MHCQKTQPPWEFLLPASRTSLQSSELSRLGHAANLRKEITALLDPWLEENASAMLARWLMEQRERPSQAPHIHARSLLSSALRPIAAMRPSPSYVLAALYLLGDTDSRRPNLC